VATVKGKPMPNTWTATKQRTEKRCRAMTDAELKEYAAQAARALRPIARAEIERRLNESEPKE